MNDIKEMVRVDLTARLNATVKRRRPKPKGMLQRAANAAAHVDVDEADVDEVLPMFQVEAKERQATSGPGLYGGKTAPDQLTGSGSVGEARDEAAPGRPAQNTGGQLSTSVGKARDEAAAMMSQGREEARKRQGQRTDLQHSGQKTTTFGKARDEAAAMMNVSPASVGRDQPNRSN